MVRRVAGLAALTIALLAFAQPQKRPVFRAGVDLMQLDVAVLDKNGKPVRGLTKDDFTLLEDDKPQTIEAFTAVDLPDAVTGGPVWSSEAPRDVTTNEIDNHRIFVIVLDDARGAGEAGYSRRELLRTSEAFVDLLGPQDLAAIVFTEQVKLSQNLTNDKAKLLKAIRSLQFSGATGGTPYVPGGPSRSKPKAQPCNSNKETLRLLQEIIAHLSTLPDRRKAIIYHGGLPWADQISSDDCGTYLMWRDVFAAAQLGHVSINPVMQDFTGVIPEHYLAVAENTGGHAVVQSNDSMPGMRQILVENSSYYLLAYQPRVENDGRFRRFGVKVNRPDVEVITRRGYWAPKPATPGKPVPEAPAPDMEALAGVLPLSALNLRVNAAPFPVPGTDKSVVALSLGVRQPAFGERTLESIDLLIKAFTPDGDERSTETVVIPITVPPPARGSESSRYEVLARVELPKPGRYELRLSALSAATNERGSVYADVEVPDFRKAKVSLSGVVVGNAFRAAPIAPERALADVVPLVPTTERAFARNDIVTTFLRVYQGGGDKLESVVLKTTIRDAAGATVFEQSETLNGDRFANARAADYQLRLPLGKLSAGEHLLTFETMVGKVAARRDVRFEVR